MIWQLSYKTNQAIRLLASKQTSNQLKGLITEEEKKKKVSCNDVNKRVKNIWSFYKLVYDMLKLT